MDSDIFDGASPSVFLLTVDNEVVKSDKRQAAKVVQVRVPQVELILCHNLQERLPP